MRGVPTRDPSNEDAMNVPKQNLTPSQEAARKIAEKLIYRTADALVSGDFDTYQACFDFPTTLESFEGNRAVNTLEDLEKVFIGVRQFLFVNNVTSLERKFIEAEFAQSDTIHTLHETYALNGCTLVKEPFPIFSVLRHVDGGWKVTRSCYALLESNELGRVLVPETSLHSREC